MASQVVHKREYMVEQIVQKIALENFEENYFDHSWRSEETKIYANTQLESVEKPKELVWRVFYDIGDVIGISVWDHEYDALRDAFNLYARDVKVNMLIGRHM